MHERVMEKSSMKNYWWLEGKSTHHGTRDQQFIISKLR